jgi:hypothetical protein
MEFAAAKVVVIVESGGADAVAIADMIHYKRKSLNQIREEVNSARLMLDP